MPWTEARLNVLLGGGAALVLLTGCAGVPLEHVQDGPPAEAGSNGDDGVVEDEPRKLSQAFLDLLAATGEVVAIPLPQDLDLDGGLTATGGATAAGSEPGSEEDEEGRWLFAPVPFVDPTIGYGLGLGGGYIVRMDEGSPPSTIGGGAMASENGSLGAALGFKGYFDDDRYRVTAGLAATRLEFDLTTDGQSVPLRENVLGLAGEFLWRVGEDLHAGPQVLITGVDTDVVRSSDVGLVPDDQLDTFSVGVGARLQRDTRDSTFYPRSGSLLDGQLRVFAPALSSPFAYRIVPFSYDAYLSPGETSVVAMRMAGRLAFGEVPFYAESFLGAGGDLRGYPVGTYHDDLLLAGQAEFRQELRGRFSCVAFAGLGKVASQFGEFDTATSLPSLGAGLGFLLEPKNHVNFRIDVARGRDETVVYIGVGEAF